MRFPRILSILTLFILFYANLNAQTRGIKNLPKTRILFVFDGSQSMYGYWNSDKKITIARNMLIELVDSLEKVPNVEMALRVYGHQSPVPPQDCEDTKLEVPFSKNNGGMIRQKLRWIEPKGTTPIARSLELSANDFPYDPNARNIIILITDGIEACEGDPCAVSRALQKKGVLLKPFVIGIGLDIDFTQTFKCVGKVFNAQGEKQLKEALTMAVSQAMNSTTAQINLLDTKKHPTETNMGITFYDVVSGQIKYNFVHTLNEKGLPDTLVLDPLLTYRMVAHTIPPVTIDNIELEPGKHSIFSANAAQGKLQLVRPNGNQLRDLKFIVKKKGTCEIVNVQSVDETVKYLCGRYDVEILTLPRINLNDVEIRQSELTKLQIPQPGLLTIIKSSNVNGAIYLDKHNQLQLIATIDESNLNSESFVLQPGSYRIIYRQTNRKEVLYTLEKRFKITSGGAELIKLQ